MCKQSDSIVISYLNTKLKLLFSGNRNVLFEVNYLIDQRSDYPKSQHMYKGKFFLSHDIGMIGEW